MIIRGILSLGVVVGIILGIFLDFSGIILGINLGIIGINLNLVIISINLGLIIGINLGLILVIFGVIQLVIIIKFTACGLPFPQVCLAVFGIMLGIDLVVCLAPPPRTRPHRELQ